MFILDASMNKVSFADDKVNYVRGSGKIIFLIVYFNSKCLMEY